MEQSAATVEYDDGAELSQEEAAAKERATRLDAFGMALAKTRSKAIAFRQQSGIETIWREDQEFYEGIDDLNRGDDGYLRSKPREGGGGAAKKPAGRSRVFPNITGPFVEAAAAHMSDILLPTEDCPWSFDPTPIPELMEKAEQYQKENPEQAKAESKKGFLARVKDRLTNPNRNESEARDSALIDQDPGMTAEEAFQQVELAKKVAEATQNRVWDWHVECQFNAQMRAAIEDAARIGTGVIKGPIPRELHQIGWQSEAPGEPDALGNTLMNPGEIKITKEHKPYSKRVDPENLYPAAGCGDNIQNGDHIWERDFLTKRQLLQLAKDETYLADQIMLCLKEGPMRAQAELPETVSLTADPELGDKFEIWFGHTMAERDDLEAAGCDCTGITDPYLDVMVIMVNYRVIKASLPTTEYAGFPYDVYCWRKRKNFWAGMGVSRQVRTAQKIVVGATRTMMDNAGLAGGPMIVFKQGVVRPADNVAGLAPRKVFYIAKDDQTIADATKAIGQIKVDIMVNEMMAIINFGLQMAENNSGFPMLMQGQMGRAPDLVGVVNVLDKNTNAIKRRLGRNFSDDVMAPHLRRYYIYHLMYGPDNEKGDLQINVKGYASQVERDIRNQELGQMHAIVIDPRFGLDPKKWAKEFMRARHMPADSLQFEDEEWEQMMQNWQQMMQQQGDPRVQVAQINAGARLQSEQLRAQVQGAIKLSDNQFKQVEAEMDRRLDLLKMAANQEIEGMRRQGVSQDVIRKAKTDLAKQVMQIQSTFTLAGMEASADRLPQPPMEPPGRAPAGESYTQ